MSDPRRVILLGALSTVAVCLARIYAAEGADLVMVARHRQRLEDLAADLVLRGAGRIHLISRDLTEGACERDLFDWVSILGSVDHIVILYGTLGDQARAEIDEAYARDVMATDFTSPAIWALAATKIIRAQGRGSLVVIGSVAGDRGRQSNYLYGSTKAGLSVLLQGIAHKLAGTGARAVIIKPGFIATRMTEHLNTRGLLWASPETIARTVRRAAERSGPIVYAPGFWRLIMIVIRLTPAWLFHKTKL